MTVIDYIIYVVMVAKTLNRTVSSQRQFDYYNKYTMRLGRKDSLTLGTVFGCL